MIKILFKPIKWVLSIVLGLVLMIVIPLAIMYKSVTPPTIGSTTLNLEEYLVEQLDEFIDPANTDKRLDLLFNEELINQTIKDALIKQFGDSNDANYVYKTDNVNLQGAWVEFREDAIDIVVGVHADARIMTYKTRLLISFKIISNEEQNGTITLRLDKLKLGNMSFKFVVRYAPGIASKILGQDIDSIIEESVGSFAEYDSKKMELKVDLYSLTDHLEENKDLAILLLDLIYDNELLELGMFEDDEDYLLGIRLNLNKLEDRTPAYILPTNERIETQEELETFLYNKALAGIVSSNNAISFNNLEMNKVIDFILSQSGQTVNEYLMKSNVYKDYEAIIGLPYINIDNDLTVNVPVKLGLDPNYFETTFKLKVELDVIGNDLVISFNQLNVGELSINEDHISEILALLDNEDFSENELVVADFFEPFKEAGIEITSITVDNDILLFNFEGFNISEILDDIKTIINNPALNDKVDDILDKIANEEEITEEDIEELLEIFETLTPEQIDELQDIINNYLPTP